MNYPEFPLVTHTVMSVLREEGSENCGFRRARRFSMIHRINQCRNTQCIGKENKFCVSC